MKKNRKTIILNFPSHGCINPLLSTVSELVHRGEKVIYYCTEEFRSKIRQTGAELRPYKGLIKNFKIDNYDIYKLLKFQIEMTVDKLGYNLDVIRKEKPDYIIHDSLCIWGKQIASILRCPAVNLMHSFPFAKTADFISTDTAPTLLKIGLYKLMNRLNKNSPIETLKKKYDINLSIGDAFINREDLNIIYTSNYLEPGINISEKDYCFVGPSLFFKKGQDDFPFDKLTGQRVIYISLGTLHNNNPHFYDSCLDGFAEKEYHVVMSIGNNLGKNKFNDVPRNFIIRHSVPQQKLLEKVDLFLTHGGMNSVNEAICCGVPMLLFPHQYEQKMISQRVREMGIGNIMKIKRITSTKIFENAVRLLSIPKYKREAVRYKSIFREEEKTSHIKAADMILNFINKQHY